MLLIDIGNTRIKSALWQGDELRPWPAVASTVDAPLSHLPQALVAHARPARVLVSNVAGAAIGDAVAAFAMSQWHVAAEFVRPQRTCAGMTTAYAEPARLGVDRWLVALAAWQRSHAPVCVVDFGTALTVDVVTARGKHLGGLIAPGLDLMRTSLTKGTAQLISDSDHIVEGFANNTGDAIYLGCISAVRGLLNETRARLATVGEGTAFTWYLTGGGSAQLKPFITWPHHVDDELVLHGLMAVADQA